MNSPLQFSKNDNSAQHTSWRQKYRDITSSIKNCQNKNQRVRGLSHSSYLKGKQAPFSTTGIRQMEMMKGNSQTALKKNKKESSPTS